MALRISVIAYVIARITGYLIRQEGRNGPTLDTAFFGAPLSRVLVWFEAFTPGGDHWVVLAACPPPTDRASQRETQNPVQAERGARGHLADCVLCPRRLGQSHKAPRSVGRSAVLALHPDSSRRTP